MAFKSASSIASGIALKLFNQSSPETITYYQKIHNAVNDKLESFDDVIFNLSISEMDLNFDNDTYYIDALHLAFNIVYHELKAQGYNVKLYSTTIIINL